MIVRLFLALLLIVGCAGAPARPTGNLLPNSQLRPGPDMPGRPADWEPGRQGGFGASDCYWTYNPLHKAPSLSIQGASDGSGFWACTVNGIQPHSTYKLSFWTSRDIQRNRMYPEVEFLGRRILLDQIWFPGRVYPVEIFFESGERQGPQTLRLINDFPVAISFSHLELTELPPGTVPDKKCLPPARAGQYLPLGIYQAPPSAYGRVAAAGLDTVLVQPKPEDIAAAQRAGLACLIKAPQTEAEWEKFKTSLKQRRLTLLPRDGFYLADEPELRPVPPAEIEARRRRVKNDFPGLLTAMTLVRPRFVRQYRCAADIFLMDQYPLPSQPLTWLSDSLDQARSLAGEGRVWAVVQAFGGAGSADGGWPRMPTQEEIRALTFLSLVHGAKGIMFYDYPHVSQGPYWNFLKQLGSQINFIRPWLQDGQRPRKITVQMLTHYQTDFLGRPAVHAAAWRKNQKTLLIVVNVLRRPVRAMIKCPYPLGHMARELWSPARLGVYENHLVVELKPLQVKAFLFSPTISR